MKKVAAVMLAMCLMLCGCFSWMDRNYFSVEPHQEENSGSSQEMINAYSYIGLRDALVTIVETGTESATIGVEALDQEKLESYMAMAVRYVISSSPIGAYAVEDINYEQGTSAGVPAVAVNITYLHNRAEIERIQQVEGMQEAADVIAEALDECNAAIVFLVDGYVKTDFTQMIEDYAELHPETVMEIPTVTVNLYPDSGLTRVVELKFTYQTSRDSLRTMQGRVQNVFASARLYVSGDAPDYEKYSQLFSFLANRFQYVLETSITPSYSLLCHGVGDAKAHAVCFAAMCRQVGLECLVVSGTREGEPWFWNIICDEGVYYHVDLIQLSQSGGFRELTDSDMAGYVWDYSAYPECGVIEDTPEDQTTEPPETAQQAEETGTEPPETDPPTTGPMETEPFTEPTEAESMEDPAEENSLTEPTETELSAGT